MNASTASPPKPTDVVILLSALVKLILALADVDRKVDAVADFASKIAGVWAGSRDAASPPIGATVASMDQSVPPPNPELSLIAALQLFGISSFEIDPEVFLAVLERDQDWRFSGISVLRTGEPAPLSAMIPAGKPNVLDNATVQISQLGQFKLNLPSAHQMASGTAPLVLDVPSTQPLVGTGFYWRPAPDVRCNFEIASLQGAQPFLSHGIRVARAMPAAVQVIRIALQATNGFSQTQLFIWDSRRPTYAN